MVPFLRPMIFHISIYVGGGSCGGTTQWNQASQSLSLSQPQSAFAIERARQARLLEARRRGCFLRSAHFCCCSKGNRICILKRNGCGCELARFMGHFCVFPCADEVRRCADSARLKLPAVSLFQVLSCFQA